MKKENLNLSEAIDSLKEEDKLALKNWNEKNMQILLQTPDDHSKMTVPYICKEKNE